jgi:predicted small secreted protein
VTVPVGVPEGEETVAVKVTDCAYVEGFGEEVIATALSVGITTWLRTEEALPEKLALPLYTAVMDLAPGVSVVVVRLAMPAFSVTDPRLAAPFLNVTVPVGAPEGEETVAMKVTACPNVEGFGEEISATALAA